MQNYKKKLFKIAPSQHKNVHTQIHKTTIHARTSQGLSGRHVSCDVCTQTVCVSTHNKSIVCIIIKDNAFAYSGSLKVCFLHWISIGKWKWHERTQVDVGWDVASYV